MYATVFVHVSYGVIMGNNRKTAEECLSDLQTQLRVVVDYLPTLTFQPATGLIFCQEMSSHIPLGVLYREKY